MSVEVKLDNNADAIYSKIGGNVLKALEAMGQTAVGLIVYQMEYGYEKNIRQTGKLQKNVDYEVNRSGENTVDVGNTLFYGPYVHEGTIKMSARHYIRDTLMDAENQKKIQDAAETELADGFDTPWLD